MSRVTQRDSLWIVTCRQASLVVRPGPHSLVTLVIARVTSTSSTTVSVLLEKHHEAVNLQVLKEKDDRIGELLVSNKKLIALTEDQTSMLQTQSSQLVTQSSQLATQSSMIQDQSSQIMQLLGYATDTKQQLAELHIKFDKLFDFTSSFARMMLSAWNGPAVFKTQLDHLIRGKVLSYALHHLKVICTNFADVSKRIRELYKRNCTDAAMTMLRPAAICLISQEINCERANLEQLSISGLTAVTYIKKRKAYSAALAITDPELIQQKYDEIVQNVRNENFQGYQMRRATIVAEDDYEINTTVQEYIDCFTIRDPTTAHGYKPVKMVARRAIHREELDEALPNNLNELLDAEGAAEGIEAMIRNGALKPRDLKALVRLSKAAAEAENIDVTEEDQQHLEEVEALTDDEDSD
ncbi:hypothetical protein ON010_g11884 [Phytophthora cinnamomi]|nr:hypothetical protein ON010_g11884 [Phytophthora cinnamomi]